MLMSGKISSDKLQDFHLFLYQKTIEFVVIFRSADGWRLKITPVFRVQQKIEISFFFSFLGIIVMYNIVLLDQGQRMIN